MDQVVIRNTEDEDSVCRLIVAKDHSVEVIRLGVSMQKGRKYSLALGKTEQKAILLSHIKFTIRVLGEESLIFTSESSQALVALLNQS